MSLLAQGFREEMIELAKKTKDPSLAKEDGYPTCIPTTLIPLDYRNGMRVELETVDASTLYSYDAIGLGCGSMNMMIGKTGCGKTAAAIQMACGIVQRFTESFVLHLDLENGANKMRIRNLSGWSSRMIEDQYSLKCGARTVDEVKTILLSAANNKRKAILQYPKEMTYFTGTYDVKGQPVYEIIPSVAIVDSVASMTLTDDAKDSSNMDGARKAKAISEMVTQIMPAIGKVNIIVIFINHINQKINTGFFPTQAQTNYLGQDESISGKVA